MSVDWRSFDACWRNPIEIVYCLEMFSILSEIGWDWHWSDRFIVIGRCSSTSLPELAAHNSIRRQQLSREMCHRSLSDRELDVRVACTHHCTIKEATLFLFDRAYCDIIIIKREENDRERRRRRRNEQMNDRSLIDQADSCAQREEEESERRERKIERGREREI